jgi:hypothetical protein
MMGKKRAVHVVQVRCEVSWFNYYAVKYKHSKCRHAKTHLTYVQAKDELDAYIKVSINREGVRQ